MKFFKCFIVLLLCFIWTYGMQIKKTLNKKEYNVNQGKELSFACLKHSNFETCLDEIVLNINVPVSIVSGEDFGKLCIFDLNQRTQSLKKIIQKQCLFSDDHDYIQKLNSKMISEDKSTVLEMYNTFENSKKTAFTSYTDTIIISKDIVQKNEKPKDYKMPFSIVHEIYHVILGRVGGIIANLADSNFLVEGITNYLARNFAKRHKDVVENFYLNFFYEISTNFISDCIDFIGNNNFLIKIFTDNTEVENCNYEYFIQINDFQIKPRGADIIIDELFSKIKVLSSTIKREHVESFVKYEVKSKTMNKELAEFFSNYNENNPFNAVFSNFKPIKYNAEKWKIDMSKRFSS